jgi:hypothetical protein
MEKLKVLGLLEKYKGWVDKGEIQFLKKGSPEQKNILALLKDIISDFAKATEKPGDLSDNLDWRETHRKGEELWHALASYSLNDIDASSKGNAKLFLFLDAATEFEDILYGLEPYYRDHTLHSLWVYFIGEHILRDHLKDVVYANLNWYLYNDIERDKVDYKPGLIEEARRKQKELVGKVNERKDAIWCLIALCHDLGYSIAKLSKLNEKVRKVLDFLDIRDIPQVGYSLNLEHKFLTDQFLELMAVEVRIVPSGDERTPLIKLYRDDPTYWRLCKELEKRQHGVLSSYLIYKILGIFADATVRGPGEEWGLEDEEVLNNLIRGDILFAISQHEFEFAYLNELGSLADILVLADELEEFSRYGRQMLTREYHDTNAECGINFKTNKGLKEIEIYITYEVAEKHSLRNFFRMKTNRLSQLYTLTKKDKNSKLTIGDFYSIKCIKLEANKKGERFSFFLGRDSITAYLPAAKIKGKTYEQKEHRLIIRDDDLLVQVDDKSVSMDEWFLNETRTN